MSYQMKTMERIRINKSGSATAGMMESVKTLESRIMLSDEVEEYVSINHDFSYDKDRGLQFSHLYGGTFGDIKVGSAYYLPIIEELMDKKDFRENVEYACVELETFNDEFSCVSYKNGELSVDESNADLQEVVHLTDWVSENCTVTFQGMDNVEEDMYYQALDRLLDFRDKYVSEPTGTVTEKDGNIYYQETFETDHIDEFSDDIHQLDEYARENGFHLRLKAVFLVMDGRSVAGAVIGTDAEDALREAYCYFQ